MERGSGHEAGISQVLRETRMDLCLHWPRTSLPSKHETLPNAGLMLGQRRRRWANINPALGQRLVLAGFVHCWFVQCYSQQTWDVWPTLVYCWANLVDGGPTVNQRWANVSCFLGRHKYKEAWMWLLTTIVIGPPWRLRVGAQLRLGIPFLQTNALPA